MGIRTEGMHRQAEYGNSGHWSYKVGDAAEATDAALDAVRELFDGIDEDQDGHINARELVTMLSRFGVDASLEEAASMIEVFDTDRDGGVSFQEFWKALVSTWFPLISRTHKPRIS